MLQGHGSANATIMLVSDGGSKEDLITNYALTGYQELLLEQVISGAFHLKETYRTALIKEKIDWRAEEKVPYYEIEENKLKVPQYLPRLIEEIKGISPNIIIPLGEMSMRVLTGLEGIRKFRGSVLLINPSLELNPKIKILPILGPHLYNTEFKQRWIARIDFAKVPLYSHDDVMPSESRHTLWIAKNSAALRAFLQRSYDPHGKLVFDIETFMGMPTCISFCFNGIESVCVPFMDKSIDIDNRVLMLGQIAKVLASPIRKVNQNIKYDWKVLERFAFEVANVGGDTMLAASCLYPELPKNLGFLTSLYTDIPYFKDEGRMFDPSIHKKEQYYLYNAKDSLATWQVDQKQQDEIDETGSRFVYDNLIACMPLYKSMENNGILIDDLQRQRLLAKYQSLFEIQLLKLRKMGNLDTLNPLSPLQMSRLIFEELGFKKNPKAKDTGEESLEWLYVFGTAERSPVWGKEILKVIIGCRHIHKVIEYLETDSYLDGAWRCEYNLAGTKTGRTSASTTTDQYITVTEVKKGKKVSIEDYGRSFQTIAKHGFFIDGDQYGKELRTIFVPRPGYVFIEIDLSQAEARVDTVLAGNFDLLAVFDGPTGIHRLTGSWVFNCSPSDIKKNTDQYHMAKTVRHAGERNMKHDRLELMTQCTRAEAIHVLDTFHKFQPEIRGVFHRDIIECVNATRTLVAPNGRRRQFLDRIDSHTYNEAISQLPQCIVGDQNKFSLPETFKHIPYARLINEAHDGTLAEVPIGKEAEYIREYQKNVERPIDFRRCSLPREFDLIIPSEASISDTNWYELRDWKG